MYETKEDGEIILIDRKYKVQKQGMFICKTLVTLTYYKIFTEIDYL
jgi:hypothetical protein